MKLVLASVVFVALLQGCSTQERADAKEDIQDSAVTVGKGVKEGAVTVGHGVRDATRETGHFFRDTAKEIFTDEDSSEASEDAKK